MGFKKKEILIYCFVYSDFNYYPLVLHFCSAKSQRKIEKIQEQALRILYGDYEIEYTTFTSRNHENLQWKLRDQGHWFWKFLKL